MRSINYDRANSRLVYVGVPANESFWDDRWAERLTPRDIRSPDRFVVNTTRRYLPKGARVVDAGCGLSRTVYGLQKAGYDAYGVDYAPSTVSAIKRLVPELDVRLGGVREMPFADEYFDGVWSLGVVEHFYDGFETIAKETARILKPGGYAFVTVPSMSPLRQLRAWLGAYPAHDGSTEGFYQFALPRAAVVKGFEDAGLKLLSVKGRGGFLGLKEALGHPAPLQKFYESRITALRAMRVGIDKVLSPITCHTRLFVFRKTLTAYQTAVS